MFKNLDTKTIKKSLSRLVISGNHFELYNYQNPYIYNLPPREKKSSLHSEGVQLERREDNLLTTQKKIRRIINANTNQYGQRTKFITFTFRENETNLKKANEEWQLFCKKMRYRYGKLKYIAVVEFQKRGAIHYHVLYFNLPYIKDIKTKLGKTWGKGFINIKTLSEVRNVGAYVCKYLRKDIMDQRLVGEKVYFTSRGIFKPIEFKNEDTIAKTLRSVSIHTDVQKSYTSLVYGKIIYSQGIIYNKNDIKRKN